MSADSNRYEILEPRGSQPAMAGSQNSIGEGAYGIVYVARDRETGRLVALKKIRIPDSERDSGISSSTLREITLLKHLNHVNVVSLINVVMDRFRISLIFELVDLDLKKYMDNTPGMLSSEIVQSFAAQMLTGIEYCHLMGVMHRDLKPHNILVTRDGCIKIADFGLARTFSPFQRSMTLEVITRWYRAPEVLLGNRQYGCSVDIWSIGCIIAEMSNKAPLFNGNCDADQLHKIFQLLGTPHAEDWAEVEDLPYYRPNFPQWPAKRLSAFLPRLSTDGVDLLERMFKYHPKSRITAKEALEHPYLSLAVQRLAERFGGEGDSVLNQGTPVNVCTPPANRATGGVGSLATSRAPSMQNLFAQTTSVPTMGEMRVPYPHPSDADPTDRGGRGSTRPHRITPEVNPITSAVPTLSSVPPQPMRLVDPAEVSTEAEGESATTDRAKYVILHEIDEGHPTSKPVAAAPVVKPTAVKGKRTRETAANKTAEGETAAPAGGNSSQASSSSQSQPNESNPAKRVTRSSVRK